MSDGAQELPFGSAVLHGFTKRAARIVSNAQLFDLVSDMAAAIERQNDELGQMKAMLVQVLERLPSAE